MSKFNLFKPSTWFSSEERKQRKNQDTEESVQNFYKTSAAALPVSTSRKPYKNIYYTGTSLVVVLHSGEVIMKNGVNFTLFTGVESALTEQQIKKLLSVEDRKIPEVEIETKEERKNVTDNLRVLRNDSDFTVRGNQVFLKDVELELPAVVAGSFIELLERLEVEEEHTTEWDELLNQYDALKMFWYWTALNPIESSRNDLFNFIRKNDITITTNGLLMMYRKIVSQETQKVDKKLVKFISKSYLQVKKWKKSPKNYSIFGEDDGSYTLRNKPNIKGDGIGKVEGNLADLYANLSNLQTEKTFTDSHTRTKDIKIGAIYKEDEDKIDLNNKLDCSAGLHVGSKSFGFGGFGDTGVLCLVNPMYVRSVPVSETNKMRVSEMFIVGEMDLIEFKDDVENQIIMDFSEEYCTTTVEALQEAAKKRDFSTMVCQENVTPVPLQNVSKILSHIKNRIVEVV